MARVVFRSRLVILCYHRILPDEEKRQCTIPELVITPEAFENHVDDCCRSYECVPLAEAIQRMRSGLRARRPLLTFTFDDGYWDNYAYARPILNAHGIRATFFVITSLVDSDVTPWYDRLARALVHLRENARGLEQSHSEYDAVLFSFVRGECVDGCRSSATQALAYAKSLPPPERASLVDRVVSAAESCGWREGPDDRIMGRDEVVQLVDDGHEIGSHTRTHPILTQLSSDDIHRELEGSRRELSVMAGCSIVSLAFPNGDYDETVLAASHRAGYRHAVTTRPGLNALHADPMTLRRVFMSQERMSRPDGNCSTNILQMELLGLADRLFLRRHGGHQDG